MCSSLGSSDSVAGHLVTLKFYKNNIKKNKYITQEFLRGISDSVYACTTPKIHIFIAFISYNAQ